MSGQADITGLGKD